MQLYVSRQNEIWNKLITLRSSYECKVVYYAGEVDSKTDRPIHLFLC
jgi:hypothetical protein